MKTACYCSISRLNRCGKSCRLRWTNYLRPHMKRGKFSPKEEQTILNLHSILGNKSKQQDLFNAMGSMYASVLFLGISNASSVQPMVSVERTVFYKERAAGMYSALPYAFGQVGIEIPYVLIQAIIYGIIVYSMIGFEWTAAKFF